MKLYAMPHGAPACVAALDLTSAGRTVHPRMGGARSGGRGPRPPGAALARAGVPGESQHENWSRRARRSCVRHGGTSGGIAA